MNNDEFSFQDIKEAIVRKGRIGLIVLTVTVLVGVIYIITKSPVYESEIRVRLSGASSVTEMVIMGATTPWNDVPTQLELIKSKNILKRTVDKLNLRFQPLSKDFSQFVEVKSLTVHHDNVPNATYLLELKEKGFNIMTENGDTILKGAYDTLVTSDIIDLCLTPVSQKTAGKALKFTIVSTDNAVNALSKNVKVNQEGKSFIAVVKARAGDPILAKRIAEEIATGYYEFTLEDVRSQANSLRLFLEEQIINIENDLTNYENQLTKIKDELGTYNFFALENLSESMKDIFSKMNDLEFEKVRATIEKAEAENEISIIKQQMEGHGYFKEYAQIAANLETSGDPKLTALLNRLYDLELKKASLSQKYNEENPEIKAINSQIEEIKKSLIKTQEEGTFQAVSTSDPVFQQLAQQLIRNQVNQLTLATRVTAIDSSLKIYESKIGNLPENALMHSRIKRKINALSGIYSLLLEKLEQTKIEEASKISDVRIVDYAMIPTTPVSPKKFQTIFITVILGAILGLFTTLTLYNLDDTVKFASEVENITGRPCLAKIPTFNNSRGKANEVRLVVDRDPLSPVTESFKKLRFNTEILCKEHPKIIAVTSCIENEGKSTTVANLALAYAFAGYKTLIIDGDLRKPTQHEIFSISNEVGFSDLITRNTLKPYNTEFPNLFVLPAGTNSLNVLKVLDAFDLSKIRDLLLENFDIIIVDTPPILPVAESNTLASFAGNLILVTRAEFTSKKLLYEVVKSIPETVNFPGVVVNSYRGGESYYKHYKYYKKSEKNGTISTILHKLGKK